MIINWASVWGGFRKEFTVYICADTPTYTHQCLKKCFDKSRDLSLKIILQVGRIIHDIWAWQETFYKVTIFICFVLGTDGEASLNSIAP